MTNTNIQFFTEDQTQTVTEFTFNLFDEDRDQKRKDVKTSEEFKTKVEELRTAEYGKSLESDKKSLIKSFNEYTALFTTLKSAFGEDGSQNILELVRNPHWYIGGKEKDDISLPKLPKIEVKDLPAWIVRDYASSGRSEKELIEKIDEYINDRLISRVSHDNYQFNTNLWSAKEQMKAIIATMPACDESQAVDKVIEKMPYDEVNEMSPSDSEDNGAKCEEPVCCEG